ncbi:hypothetical protein [Microterricola viridarii]|uniref:Uncharacterized protein n=1 Tax=Microterricola viridarii TaxID=412690 RepID=A0A1H1T3P7_9MICO|nr:hypothetical protein [Microterricola viridarii]SDS54852.1 hypothetical protein SAMN04489834_1684 [Microterricola viridarii]
MNELPHETLLPSDAVPGAGILLAVDVDGVLNTIDVDQWERNRRTGQSLQEAMPPAADGFERRHIRTAHGDKYWVDIDPQVILALDAFVRTHNVELAWLTTWGPNVRAFIEQALDGKLSGGFVLAKKPPRYRGAVPAEWKRTALRARIETTGQPWIWADDEEIAIGRTWSDFDEDPIFAVPNLMFEPAPTVGLTVDDVAAMERFAVSFHTGACTLGITSDELRAILGDRLPAFEGWIRGQTLGLCPEHGVVVYRIDLERFVTKSRVAFD